ncbi:hypothetical protein CYLTODRAFT_495080 [Cylindrobasidium torrendii FP15055 ss-10]|uniref:Uncharacterized protein n=1 Tax=Cylindrobasidium torrendii FP15055 ss-10 TaxID=1314674 RepID=A0A0D7AU73_9AGAR|nr:hypothetical protein CYLTODRAFT_495080 [Cylindrobasidium torrendii FP15055 ss-10]
MASSTPDLTDEDIHILFAPGPYAQPTNARLSKLVALPQTQKDFDAPFVRAYPYELQVFAISKEEWMQFCDGLNIAMVGSPPLAVVNQVGKILGFVPEPVSMVTSIAMRAGAQTGMRILSKTATDRYLSHANDTFFAPRGLRVRLCKTPAVRALARPGSEPASVSSKAKLLQSAQSVAMHLPIASRILNRFTPAVEPMDFTQSPAQRCFAVLDCEGRIAELDYGVPPPTAPTGMVAKVSEVAVKMERRQAGRKEKVRSWRAKMANKRGMGRRNGPLGRRWRLSQQRETKKEHNALEDIVWLVVLSEAQDREIEHREIADSKEGLEVSEEDWEDMQDAYEEQQRRAA